MLDVPTEADHVRIVFLNDDATPWPFVVDLLRSTFGKSEAEATAIAATVDRQGQAVCGPYPPEVAHALLAAASRRIEEHGHPLALAAEPIGGGAAGALCRCTFC